MSRELDADQDLTEGAIITASIAAISIGAGCQWGAPTGLMVGGVVTLSIFVMGDVLRAVRSLRKP